MTRRLCLLTAILSLCLPVLAMTPHEVDRLPRDLAPYYHGEGDGPVTMVETTAGELWAVWSYRSGGELDVAVSRAIGRTWTPPVLLGHANGRDDVDPKIAVTAGGYLVVTWWQPGTETAIDTVMLAYLFEGEWTHPACASDPLRPSRHPSFFGSDLSLTLGFTEIDPWTGASEIIIRPVSDPEPAGGTNGPDPIPTIGTEVGSPGSGSGQPPPPGGTVNSKD